MQDSHILALGGWSGKPAASNVRWPRELSGVGKASQPQHASVGQVLSKCKSGRLLSEDQQHRSRFRSPNQHVHVICTTLNTKLSSDTCQPCLRKICDTGNPSEQGCCDQSVTSSCQHTSAVIQTTGEGFRIGFCLELCALVLHHSPQTPSLCDTFLETNTSVGSICVVQEQDSVLSPLLCHLLVPGFETGPG